MDFRFYRDYDDAGEQRGAAFRVSVETTDLYVRAERDMTAVVETFALQAREAIAAHIRRRPEFLHSLTPLEEPGEPVPEIVLAMYRAAQAAGVGPMASVAGAVAQDVGRKLLRYSRWAMVENGGDIFLRADREVTVGLYAGTSPFSGRLGIRLEADPLPWGICTSSATVGPSLSFGCADAATVLARDAALADAAASGLGNRIKSAADIEAALDWTLSIPGVAGALAVVGDRLGCRGHIELTKLDASKA